MSDRDEVNAIGEVVKKLLRADHEEKVEITFSVNEADNGCIIDYFTVIVSGKEHLKGSGPYLYDALYMAREKIRIEAEEETLRGNLIEPAKLASGEVEIYVPVKTVSPSSIKFGKKSPSKIKV
jgi:hypothetical protein